MSSAPLTNGPPAAVAALTPRRKAAVIVQYLLSQGQSIPLAQLPEDMQADLAHELGSLRLVDRATLAAVATEFGDHLDAVALAAPRGTEAAMAALGSQISAAAAARLRAEAARRHGTDPWSQVLALTLPDLLPLMESESVEVAAVTLSKLPVASAAEVLSRLQGDRARAITLALSRTAQITPQVVARIGRALAEDHCDRPETAFAVSPAQRAGAILNASPAATRDAVLAALGDTDPGFADDLRRAIFTFADIPARLQPLDVPRAIRGLDGAGLVTGLAAALAEAGPLATAADFMLANMSQRMADQLRDEIREKGKIRKADGEAAMGQIVTAIRARADAGELTLRQQQEDEG